MILNGELIFSQRKNAYFVYSILELNLFDTFNFQTIEKSIHKLETALKIKYGILKLTIQFVEIKSINYKEALSLHRLKKINDDADMIVILSGKKLFISSACNFKKIDGVDNFNLIKSAAEFFVNNNQLTLEEEFVSKFKSKHSLKKHPQSISIVGVISGLANSLKLYIRGSRLASTTSNTPEKTAISYCDGDVLEHYQIDKKMVDQWRDLSGKNEPVTNMLIELYIDCLKQVGIAPIFLLILFSHRDRFGLNLRPTAVHNSVFFLLALASNPFNEVLDYSLESASHLYQTFFFLYLLDIFAKPPWITTDNGKYAINTGQISPFIMYNNYGTKFIDLADKAEIARYSWASPLPDQVKTTNKMLNEPHCFVITINGVGHVNLNNLNSFTDKANQKFISILKLMEPRF